MIMKDPRLPLYFQLMDTILEKIELGELKENEKLPSERELCELYSVSRTTVRQTMQSLERDGYIYKVHGKGSFVSPKKYNQSLIQFYSFTEEMKKAEKEPSTKILSFEQIICEAHIAKKMNLSEDSDVFKLTRLRLADDEPMLYETTYLPVSRFDNLTKNQLENTPMYEVFHELYNVTITKATETFKAVSTRTIEAEYLQIIENTPSLMFERITYEHDTIIEYTASIARGDKFSYTVELK
ncbi:GntR family transcriptional regulator [Neobacillus kokaensis]|uniref:GntR family transcriptional regulator n=1 Tax=Neobacillus kokaensis TaxID=2759023 RepID=A0ABQ3N8T5_9BACI|nr:GntR family transcriptional regulator [Neobacillus kokaensis]GHI00088.1 GntR family transcriptional regulator [Neobacillus kokaensis]